MRTTASTAPASAPDEDLRGATRRAGGARRVALLGAGYIADWHARALAMLDGVELVAVCDTVLGRAEALAARYRIPGVHASLAALLERERLDAVHVLLPPDRHFEAAREILEAGIDVLLEKPMCATAEECERLIAIAEARGVAVGVAHNFSFSEPYQRLRADVRAGLLGPLDQVTITWHRELPQVRHGPFDGWMLREPENVMLEIGSHAVAHVLDLVGQPEQLRVKASNPVELPGGAPFYRRWHVDGERDRTGIEMRFSFVPGFTEHSVQARGLLGIAVADLDRNTYALRRHHACGDDLDRYRMVSAECADLGAQARRTLRRYVMSKLHLERRGSPYATGIAGAMKAFHLGPASGDGRISARTGADVIRTCERIGQFAGIRRKVPRVVPGTSSATGSSAAAKVLVLGATGFIGQELVRQLVSRGEAVRLLVRSPGKVPSDLRGPGVAIVPGDLEREADLRGAMEGTTCVYHLARANVKTWADYRAHEVEATRRVAEAALDCGVKRFVYTGTIDSYYAGRGAGVITEATPLDRDIAHRNYYARAKAESERLLLELHRQRGLPLVIYRPGIVVGRGGSPFHWGVGMWWYDSQCQVWGDGRNPLPLVLVEDVARALVAGLDAPGIEGASFNLVGDVRLTAQEYLDEIDRCAGMRIQRQATPIARFFAVDLFKCLVKTAVRHPDRRLPSFRDWESRTQRADFDCTRAKQRLGWMPVGDRAAFVQQGIELPIRECFL